MKPAVLKFLAEMQGVREMIRNMRATTPPHMKHRPDWDLHLRRIDEIERIVRLGRPQDAERLRELHEEFALEYQADVAACMAEASERIVRLTDQMAQRAEEKKFELSEQQREGLDELLEPYKDVIRDEMLGILPIETRRDIEAKKRQMEEE